MDVLDFLNRNSGVLCLGLIFVIGLFLKFYISTYFKKKGENLATKEDIAGITHEIEGVKRYYMVELEKYKNVIWRGAAA